jgi:hypothetical protein
MGTTTGTRDQANWSVFSRGSARVAIDRSQEMSGFVFLSRPESASGSQYFLSIHGRQPLLWIWNERTAGRSSETSGPPVSILALPKKWGNRRCVLRSDCCHACLTDFMEIPMALQARAFWNSRRMMLRNAGVEFK